MVKPSLRAPVSWVVYDVANTIYSSIVVTLLINPYVEGILHAASYAAVANFCSMVAAGLVAPALGEITDRTGTSKRWLVLTTIVSCAACLLMTAAHFLAPPLVAVWLILLAFAAANFCYQLSLVFYNSLLPGLVPPERVGTWSGIGVGAGYFGTTIGMGALLVVLALGGDAAVGFGAAGVLFLLLSLPLFAWVTERKERIDTDPPPRVGPALRQSARIWAATLREPVPRRFLIGNFCLTDALNTTIFVFSLYCVKVFDAVANAQAKELLTSLIALSLAGLPLGVLCGRISDRRGPKTGLLLATGSLGVALAAGVLLPADRFGVFLVFLTTFGAFGLAGIWTAGRALLVRIAPPRKIGEYFGMYGLSLKVSVLGAITFGLLADHLPFEEEALRYRIALASVFVPLALGLWLIGGLEVGDEPQS